MKIKRFNEDIDIPIKKEHGWINIKVDNMLEARIKKYLERLNFENDFDIIDRFDYLLEDGDDENSDFYSKITYLIILQYLKEIRDNFDASASGLLMEVIVSSMMYGNRVSGNKKEDIMINGESYQIKFYNKNTYVYIKDDRLCDHTIIFVKDAGDIYIFLIDRDYIIKNFKIGSKGRIIAPSQLIKHKDTIRKDDLGKISTIKYTKIDFLKMDVVINSIADDIKSNIADMFDNLSKLHEGIDMFLIGDCKIDDVIEVSNNIVDNIRNINNDINNNDINNETYKKDI